MRADFKNHGIIQLDTISDELAVELAKEGCPYIVLTREGKKLLKPAAKPIEVKKIPPAAPPARTIIPKKPNTGKGAGTKHIS